MSVWYVGSTKWAAVTAWAASTAYSVGDLRRQLATPSKTNERVWRCTTAGTSGGTEPAWTLTKGSTTNDGSAVWTEVTGNSAYGWGAAAATWYHILNGWAAAGDTIYVSSAHSGDLGSNAFYYVSAGTAASPVEIICVDDSAAPPTAVATGAVEFNSNGFDGRIFFGGYAYAYGVELQSGGDSQAFSFSNSDSTVWTFDTAVLYSKYADAIYWQIGRYNDSADDQCVTLINTTVRFAHVGQRIYLNSSFVWQGGGLHTSSSVPTNLFVTRADVTRGDALIVGVDLSIMGSGKSLVDVSGGSNYKVDFLDCKLGSSVSLTTGTVSSPHSAQLRVVNCDSADTNYRYYKKNYQGEVFSETTIVKASTLSTDGTTPLTWKMVSSANTKFWRPLQSDWMVVWCDSTGSKTITVNVVTDNVTLTDAECWLEVEYLGTSGYPIASIAKDRAASVLATPANQTTDGVSSWTTTGIGTPVKQNLAVTVTVNEKGPIRCRVCVAKASTTVYVDRAPVVT